jgi:hypothetical protein
LTEVLGIKYWNLRWVPQTLKYAQQVTCIELAQSMLQSLAKHEQTNYHFLFTSNESWTLFADDHRTKEIASWDGVDEIERPLHFH